MPAAGPRQHEYSWFRASRDSWPYFLSHNSGTYVFVCDPVYIKEEQAISSSQNFLRIYVFDTTQTAQKTTRPTILLLLRVYYEPG
jgi:hypothetical protein